MIQSPLKVGFVTARPAFMDGDQLWADAGLGRLVDALAERFSRLTFAYSAAPERLALHDHRFLLAASDVVALPWLPTFVRGLPRVAGCRRGIAEVERRSDVVIVQLPFASPLAMLGPRRPRVYHLCADVHAIAANSPAYTGAKHWLAKGAGMAVAAMQRRLIAAPGARVVTNGRDLFSGLPGARGRASVSSTILDREILSVPRKRPTTAPFRVLFVGYLRPEKGFDTLFDAFGRLLGDVPDAELAIVGTSAVEHGTKRAVAEGLARLQSRGRALFFGHQSFGPELFQSFADADVLVVASVSEGTPRVLVEARAFGCPVIASRVGGIPTSVEHEVDGLLFPPGDAQALHRELVRVARDRELRRALAERGVARARRCTIEAFADALAEEVSELAASRAEARRVASSAA